MVKYIRNIEKGLSEKKNISLSEKKNIKYSRKSIFARKIIKKGENFSINNLVIKRPATGLSPIYWKKIIKLKALKKYLKMKKYQKKICIISSSRADYGLLRNLIKKLYRSKRLKYHLSITGTHLSFKHGYTLKEIINDKIFSKYKIEYSKL